MQIMTNTSTNSPATLRVARALAERDGLDYFERGNLAGIADLVLVADEVVAAARAAGDGAQDSALIGDPIAVGAAARALADLEGDDAFSSGNQFAMDRHLRDARAMLSALPEPVADRVAA